MTIVVLALILVACFYYHNQKLKHVFAKNIKGMDELMVSHERQLECRLEALNRYDFLLYNLREALKIQKDIEL
ncbi:MAG: hypothetical protein Aureis2KO_06590 [Aureisphaera sp.]